MKNKYLLLTLIFLGCLVFSFTSCSKQKQLKPDTPAKTAIIMENFLNGGNYESFNKLFTEGRKNTISLEQFNELKKLTTDSTDLKHYELLTFSNGEMILVKLTQEKIDGEYKIEDITGYSNMSNNFERENETLKRENALLKDKVAQLDKNLNEAQLKLKLNNDELRQIAIDYVEVDDKLRFIEKEKNIYLLPKSSSVIMRPVAPNTLATVYEKALVDKEYWLFVQIPTYDSPINNRGWIKESDTSEFTEDKVKLVQREMGIKAGAEVYEVENFEDIAKTTPTIWPNEDSGALGEKKDGYCRFGLAGGRTIWVKESDVVYPKVQ